MFQSLNVNEAESRRKAGNLLYYHQISMKNLHQSDLLYSEDPCENLNYVGSVEKTITYFLLPNCKSTLG